MVRSQLKGQRLVKTDEEGEDRSKVKKPSWTGKIGRQRVGRLGAAAYLGTKGRGNGRGYDGHGIKGFRAVS